MKKSSTVAITTRHTHDPAKIATNSDAGLVTFTSSAKAAETATHRGNAMPTCSTTTAPQRMWLY